MEAPCKSQGATPPGRASLPCCWALQAQPLLHQGTWAFHGAGVQGPRVQLPAARQPTGPSTLAQGRKEPGRWLVGRLVVPPRVGSQLRLLCAASSALYQETHGEDEFGPRDRPPGSQLSCLSSRKPSLIAPRPHQARLCWLPLHLCCPHPTHSTPMDATGLLICHPTRLWFHEDRSYLVFRFWISPSLPTPRPKLTV